MTRRDYVLLSAALRKAMGRALREQAASASYTVGVELAACAVADALKAANPKFDHARFVRDVGVVS